MTDPRIAAIRKVLTQTPPQVDTTNRTAIYEISLFLENQLNQIRAIMGVEPEVR